MKTNKRRILIDDCLCDLSDFEFGILQFKEKLSKEDGFRGRQEYLDYCNSLKEENLFKKLNIDVIVSTNK